MDDSNSTRSEPAKAQPLDPADTPGGDDSFVTIPPTRIRPPSDQKDTRRYEFQAMVGRGGMGNVYRVLDRSLGRVVALKVIRSDALTPSLRARFADEARAVARLAHPHIVQVFDVGETVPPGEVAPVPFLTLEYVERGSLAAGLTTNEPLTSELAARVVARIARGMQHAHHRGIVQRDLKPENVLLAPRGDVEALNTPLGCPKVTDFGLARLVQADNRLTLEGAVMGTPAYMAPEQAEGLPEVGPPADVYALGVILYRLLTGRVPFASDSLTQSMYRICHEPPVPPRRVRSGVPEELERICLGCLEKDPRNRPTMGELAAALEDWSAVGTSAEMRPVSPKRPAGRRPLLLAGLVGAVLALGGLTLFALRAEKTHLKIKPIRVTHYATVGKEEEPRDLIGDRSITTHVGDGVTLTVELSEPGYCYVIAFNCDGKEDLVWPGEESGPLRETKPPRLERFLYPPGNNRLDLGDDGKGGLQVYVVIASTTPLPPYAEWRASKPDTNWKPCLPGRAVWEADAKGVYAVAGFLRPDRSGVRKAIDQPPLDEFCRAFGGEGLTVEAIAFGVLPREGK